MADVLVYAAAAREKTARKLLGAACRASGIGAQLELYGTGALYQRLGPRHAPPLPDLVMWFGPFAAAAAAADNLLQVHLPSNGAEGFVHDPNWRWTSLDYLKVGTVGSTPVNSLQDLASIPSLAMADPER